MSRNINDGPDDTTVIHEGRFLDYCTTSRGWEFVRRHKVKGTVAIVAITDDKRLILTEQFRPPVGTKVIELPAGLAGDIPYQEDEPLVSAARRELKEETGYEARHWQTLRTGPSSAGLTTETITFFYASGLTKVSQGGGVHGEDIRVHYVETRDVPKWCADREREGMMVDFKIYAGLYLIRSLDQLTEARLWY